MITIIKSKNHVELKSFKNQKKINNVYSNIAFESIRLKTSMKHKKKI